MTRIVKWIRLQLHKLGLVQYPGREYVCEACGQTFTAAWSDEDMLAEAEGLDPAVICDDCGSDSGEDRALARRGRYDSRAMTEIGTPQREHECEPLVEPIPGPSQPVHVEPEPVELPPQRTAPVEDPVQV